MLRSHYKQQRDTYTFMWHKTVQLLTFKYPDAVSELLSNRELESHVQAERFAEAYSLLMQTVRSFHWDLLYFHTKLEETIVNEAKALGQNTMRMLTFYEFKPVTDAHTALYQIRTFLEKASPKGGTKMPCRVAQCHRVAHAATAPGFKRSRIAEPF